MKAFNETQGIEIRGRAEHVGTDDRIRIHPEEVVTCGFQDVEGSRHSRRTAPRGPMQAVVRMTDYDPAALADAGDRMRQFERAHAAQRGYAGNAVVDLGDGERIMITLWESKEHAAAARSALGPVVQELLAPIERTPSRLLGVGEVIATDLTLATARTPD